VKPGAEADEQHRPSVPHCGLPRIASSSAIGIDPADVLAVPVHVHVDLLHRHAARAGSGLDDADVSLVRNQQVDVVARELGVERRESHASAIERTACSEHLAPGHVHAVAALGDASRGVIGDAPPPAGRHSSSASVPSLRM
jgi:hypothetical protein